MAETAERIVDVIAAGGLVVCFPILAVAFAVARAQTWRAMRR